ncbi:hypothetical protein CERSUDRAFT_115738 [Gelatoporia subvermispora B]|uniref:Ubiquitin 3 binding protein But2 C-terminal domain-containing protein n=1 Tax=Ceriporiopsis subvermispora (strain B) TaxID=914234 RepID=M2QUN3_CERS8|nr:hypothetical protein CERSUDRAFT_115738 [Gelatoporia subvermispora B]
MVALSLLAAVVALPAVIASPTIRLRQNGPPGCGNGAPGDFDSAASITLTALNTTLPNSNDNGAPLVASEIEIFGAESSWVLTTQASASLRLTVSDFTLQTGALLPVSSNGQEFADSAVEPGDGIGFQRFPGNAPSGSLSEIYCGIVNTGLAGGNSSQPLLSIQGNSSNFALCESDGLNVVVFQPEDSDGCYPVEILIFEH